MRLETVRQERAVAGGQWTVAGKQWQGRAINMSATCSGAGLRVAGNDLSRNGEACQTGRIVTARQKALAGSKPNSNRVIFEKKAEILD